MSLQKNIRDLIFFYVKTNYNDYLSSNNIDIIPENEIDSVIHSLYDERKEHIQEFILKSMTKLHEDKMDQYPGDQIIKNILLNIFTDSDLCKNRLSIEIKLHQQKNRGEHNEYSKLF
tara:strand:- start:1387 stop:1737 length:351 start_codon:yes stop_codon:yes gene_type:complete